MRRFRKIPQSKSHLDHPGPSRRPTNDLPLVLANIDSPVRCITSDIARIAAPLQGVALFVREPPWCNVSFNQFGLRPITKTGLLDIRSRLTRIIRRFRNVANCSNIPRINWGCERNVNNNHASCYQLAGFQEIAEILAIGDWRETLWVIKNFR